MKRIQIALEFGGVILPVTQNEQGEDLVPLKPIVEIFGMEWMRQYKKMQAPYYTRRMGVCVVPLGYAGQQREMVCIRLDRVVAYLNSISPERVRAGGNIEGADFLEAKQQEWDDLIHDYEAAGGILARNKDLQARMQLQHVRTLLAVSREIRQSANEGARKALNSIASDLAKTAGVPFQVDFLDSKSG